MKTKFLPIFLLMFMITSNSVTVQAQKEAVVQKMKISVQKMAPSDEETGAYIRVNEIQEWNPKETAIVICDMWNEHWCNGATERVTEMAPFMNNVVSIAREKGILIVHAPSDCMDYYKNHPARKLGQKYKSKKTAGLISENKLDSEKDAVWPIDQSDGGCDCSPECKQGSPWTHQINLIEITDKDAISDSGVEIAGLFNQRGIKNVILMGVHTNMCVIGRSFGLRNMVRLGMNVVLMRDMTDTMYDSKQWPTVSHFTGNSLVNEYIETYVCPTIVSTDFTGEKQFRFKNDKRPVIAFIIAESEYRANQCLPEFAHDLLLTEGVNCEFALGKPVMEGTGRHNIENLQILNDADLAVIFVRRRALPSEQMDLIKGYVSRGKPLLGMRTASHAFDANAVVPREGGGITEATEKASDLLSQWTEFDKDILGGNYQGHYGHLKEQTQVTIVPGMENHPVLRNVPQEGFNSSNWLYRNRPLRSENIQVLLIGTIPNELPEPIFWINKTENNNIIYTSLGHWDDWKIEGFKNVMVNSIHYLLNSKK
jgi:nicotinamidase-related amidase